MAFQTVVNQLSGLGVPGELYQFSPYKAQPFTIVSGTQANNVYGRVFTKTSQGVAAAGGTNVFAGYLIGPKDAASFGTTGGGPLAPTLVLQNNQIGQLLTMGSIIVQLPAAAAIGDHVYYSTTDGSLSTIVPGGTPASGTAFAHAEVDYFTVTAAGLAVITVNYTTSQP